jgi:hypothetical protein
MIQNKRNEEPYVSRIFWSKTRNNLGHRNRKYTIIKKIQIAGIIFDLETK